MPSLLVKLAVAVLAALVALLFLATDTSARTWYITPDGTGDAATIQAGINAAAPGDTVELACGTYFEHDVVMKFGIHLVSATGQPDCATIDATQQGRVLFCDGIDSSTSIVGVTFTGAFTLGAWPTGYGGGMHCELSSPVIADCDFVDNVANVGAGISCWFSSPTVVRCRFIDNEARLTGPSAIGSGGGIHLAASSPIVSECAFISNSANDGGGIRVFSASFPTLEDCVFAANVANAGGGIASSQSSPTVERCTIVGNSVGNSAPGVGGGVALNLGSAIVFANVILWGNSSDADGSQLGLHDFASTATFSCSTVDTSAGWVWAPGPGQVFWDDTNFVDDPLFCDPGGGDFHINASSSCAPANSSGCGLIGALDVGCGPIAVEETSWAAIKSRYRKPRP